MGNIFSSRCDMCGNVQTEDDPTKLKGTNISMNGTTRHACETCVKVLKVAFEVGKEGLSDPMKALAKMAEEKEGLQRQVQKLEQVGSGNVLAIEDIAAGQRRFDLMNPFQSMQPRLGGGHAPVVHSLPAAQIPAEPATAEPEPPASAPEAAAPAAEEPKKGFLGGIFKGKKKKG